MNGRLILIVLLAVLLIAGAVGVGVYAYNAGVAQGLAQGDTATAPGTGGVPYPAYGVPFFYRPFGFGFGLLGCIVPLLFFFLFFGQLRGILWRGRGGWGGPRGHWGKGGVPPTFEEWHRKAHEPQAEEK